MIYADNENNMKLLGMGLFCKNSQLILAVNYFRKKLLSIVV